MKKSASIINIFNKMITEQMVVVFEDLSKGYDSVHMNDDYFLRYVLRVRIAQTPTCTPDCKRDCIGHNEVKIK